MSISGPAFRINESNIPNIAKKVKEYCNCISEEWVVLIPVANTRN